MNKKWIKLLKSWTQKAVGDDGKDQDFSEGDIIEVEESVAKSLIDLGMAEETEKPEGDSSLEKAMAGITKSVEAAVAGALEKALSSVGENVAEGFQKHYAVPRDENNELETNFGWKNPDHFWKAVSANGS